MLRRRLGMLGIGEETLGRRLGILRIWLGIRRRL